VMGMSKSVQRSQEGRYHRGSNEAELIEGRIDRGAPLLVFTFS